jgi:RNA polymerase sigma-70 factor (ECF subfamily)
MNPLALLRSYPGHARPAPGAGRAEDDVLVSRIEAADRDALRELYDRWCSRVYSIAFRIVPEEGAAEEITESTFWHVWRRAGEYDGSRGPVESWLEEVARSRAKECLRLCHRAGELPDPASPPGEDTLPGRPLLRRALGALPPEQRQALRLACFGGMSQSEIAECTGQPLGTIQTRIRLSMERLRAAL